LGAATATSLTVNDNTTLGSSNSDTVTFNGRVASDLVPSTDNTFDLGVTGHEWRNLNIDGTANIDSLVADTADINGGTIDSTAIGATTPSTGAFTTLSSTTDLTLNDGTANSPNINFQTTSGTRIMDMDGSTIRILNMAASNARLQLTDAGNLTVDGSITGGAISGTTGTFSDTVSTTKTGKAFGAEGATTASRYLVFTNTGNNGAFFGIDDSSGSIFGGTAYDMSLFTGTGTGIGFHINGAGSVGRFSSTGLAVTGALSSTTGANFATSSGSVGIGTASPAAKLHLETATSGLTEILRLNRTTDAADNGVMIAFKQNASNLAYIGSMREGAAANDSLVFGTRESWVTGSPSEKMRITGAGNVGIGTTSPARKLSIVSSTGDTHLTVGDTAPSISLTNDPSNPNSATKTAIFALATSAGNYGLNDGELMIGMFGNSRGNIVVNSNYSGTGTKDVVLQPSSGNVGIGTASPGSKLDVNGELRIGNTVNTVSPTSPDRTITMVIGGTTYYIHAKTTND
jgi:hypothetical protein